MFLPITKPYLSAACLLVAFTAHAQNAPSQPASTTAAAPTGQASAAAVPGETPRFGIPSNIAEAAEASRREAMKKALEESQPPKPSKNAADSQPQPAGATVARAPAPMAPQIVVPFQDMRLVALVDVDGQRVAGLNINGNVNYVAAGAAIGNGWLIQSIEKGSVVVAQMNDSSFGGKKSKQSPSSGPRVKTLMFDAFARAPSAQGGGAAASAAMPTPMPFR